MTLILGHHVCGCLLRAGDWLNIDGEPQLVTLVEPFRLNKRVASLDGERTLLMVDDGAWFELVPAPEFGPRFVPSSVREGL